MPSSILNSDDGVISGTSGLKSSGGDDGVLKIQNNGVDAITVADDGEVTFAAGLAIASPTVFPAGTASLPAITTTGDLNTGIFFPAADNIGFATNGVIRGRWTTDGLCFNADTAAANALDDYEQGTWTPTYLGSSGNPTVTYQTQNGSYVKIGEFVHFSLEIETSAASGGSGFLRVGGIPFTTSSQRYPGGGFTTYSDQFTTNAPDAGWAINNGTFISLTYHSSATTQFENVVTNLTNGSSKNYLLFTGAYRSA